MNSTRFLTGGLAAAAVASAITLSAPAANAATGERGCGLPAVPAVTQTIVTEDVFDLLPAVTHTEWLWGRDTDVLELEFLRVLSDARTETDWSRTVPGAPEFLFTQLVVDKAAVPEVAPVPEKGHDEQYVITPAETQTLAEYEHENTGKLRWERDDWGAQNGQGQGWKKTGNTKVEVLKEAVYGTRYVVDTPGIPGTPAVPAVTHTESLWATQDPGAPWAGPFGQRAGATSTETATTDGSEPAGAGWVAGDTRTFPAVTEKGWAEELPAGTTATGETRVARVVTEKTKETSAEAPDGEGWAKVDGSEVTITDVEAKKVLVTPGSITTVEISPELPATAPCVEPPLVEPVETPEVPQAAPAPTAEVSPAAVLPNTGGVPGWMIPAGLATMFAGAIVVRSSRRQQV